MAGCAFLVGWSLTTHGKFSVTGDEPHYLLVAESLRSDADLDLENNETQDDGRMFGRPGLRSGPHARVARTGAVLSVHDIGLPLFLLPIYSASIQISRAVAPSMLAPFRMNQGLLAYSLVSLFLLSVTAAAAALVHSTLGRGVPTGRATAVVLALWLSPPVLSSGFLVFPEVPALLAAAGAVWLASAPPSTLTGARLPAVALAIALLPWLHRKFGLFALGLLFVVGWSHRATIRQWRKPRIAAYLALTAAPALGLAVWTFAEWGNLGGPLTLDRLPFSLMAFRAGILGIFVDRGHGLFVWAPIYLAAPAAFWITRRESWPLLLPILLLVISSAAHDQWWGGFSPAARFLLPLAPLVALPVARAASVKTFARASIALLVPQMVISAYGWQHPRLLWPTDAGENRLIEALPAWAPRLQEWLPALRGPHPSFAYAVAVVLIVMLGTALVARRARGRGPCPPPV